MQKVVSKDRLPVSVPVSKRSSLIPFIYFNSRADESLQLEFTFFRRLLYVEDRFLHSIYSKQSNLLSSKSNTNNTLLKMTPVDTDFKSLA